MKKLMLPIIIVLSLLSYWGCAPISRGTTGSEGFHVITDISEGLPSKGLWRENIALMDMDGDGFLDIVAPPPRKVEEAKDRPYIFVRGKGKEWREGNFSFPEKIGFGYGGIAAGDVNGDGYPDIVLAVHTSRIILLENNKSGGFVESVFTVPKDFHSRAVEFADINGDGWLDIVALSEAPFLQEKPQGILIGVNRGGKGWDVRTIEESLGSFGDSLAVGHISGEGKKDIAIAFLSSEEGKKLIWFGDGQDSFKGYDKNIIGDTMPMIVRMGDIDGDGRDEVVFKLSTFGEKARFKLSVFKWNGDGFKGMSSGLEKEEPFAFDLADLDGDGKKELVVLSERAIRIYKYRDGGWVERGQYPLSPEDTRGVRDLRVGRNKDGSFLVVYNLGLESSSLPLHFGIKAYSLR